MACAATAASPAAAAVATTATATATKVLTPLQRFASVFREAHPIGRVPTYLKPHDAPALTHYLRRMGRTGVMFVPLMVTFFGWPFLMKGFINASNGVRAPGAKGAVKSKKMSRKSSIDSEAWSQRAPVGA